jgi:hypothetical protein
MSMIMVAASRKISVFSKRSGRTCRARGFAMSLV